MSETKIRIRTLTSDRFKKLARDTNVVITLAPLSGDGESVMSNLTPIPWKNLRFQANSAMIHEVIIPSKFAVCTVKEKKNKVLTPESIGILTHGGEIVFKATPNKDGVHWSNTGPLSANDDFIIRNECDDTRLALCLIDQDDECLPILDLGELPKDQTLTINGQLYIQAYAMAEQTVGKPVDLRGYDPLLQEPMAVVDLSETAFILYTTLGGLTMLEIPDSIAQTLGSCTQTNLQVNSIC